jgi:hypothetical protein
MSPNGSLSEQFNKTTGQPLSAYDLTWSLAAFVTMAERREGKYPLSWGAMDATPAPKTCPTMSGYISTDTYQPAFAAGAPKVAEFCATEVLFFANIGTNVHIPSVSFSDLKDRAAGRLTFETIGNKSLPRGQQRPVGRRREQPQGSHLAHEPGLAELDRF